MINDLTKYKRVFAFGCSFTNYAAPTWADILFSDMPNAETFNFGKGGAGNLLISNLIAQANLLYKFSETDLVLVMYTSPLREDRWINDRWQVHGNIFNQSYYDKNFVKNYCDPIGILIKDAGIIELAHRYVESLPCDTFQMIGADIWIDDGFPYETDSFADNLQKFKLLFNEVYDKFPAARLAAPNMNIQSFLKSDDSKKMFSKDGHPNPLEHVEFMKAVGIPVSDIALEYATAANQFVQTARTNDELILRFPKSVASDRMFFEKLSQ
jgi:hypothetical protein